MSQDNSNSLNELDLNKKAFLVSGKSFWEVGPVESLHLNTIIVSDGPHGLRRVVNVSDNVGSDESIKAICFPTASAQACSFDEELLFKLGTILGEECLAEDVQVLLGPANNMKRTPLCGRNFEYYSEDPFLSAKLSTAIIKGVQSKGIGTSLKHFIANNQEKHRMYVNAVIDERTLREIYLTAFEEPVKEGKPWTIMASYNRINGYYACQNKYLLQTVLRDEWHYQGLIMSDWGAVDQLHESIEAGLDLEMPTSGDVGPSKIISAVKKNKLPIKDLDRSVDHVIGLLKEGNKAKNSNASLDKDQHHQLAREIGHDCIVLLKNEDQILPITKEKYSSIAVIGDFAYTPRFQGGGSSHINPYKVDSIVDEFKNNQFGFKVDYARGYDSKTDDIDQTLLTEAIAKGKNADIALVFVGLPDRYETEGMDRKHLNMPPNHLKVVEEIRKVNKNIVVILSIGSVVKLPFINIVKGIVCSWLLGEAGAGSIYDVLMGIANPNGRLAETFIMDEKDDPSYGNYPGLDEVHYDEGVMIGYRFHDYYKKDVYYEFGYGLSYTNFEYSNLVVSKEKFSDQETIDVSVSVKNTGKYSGKEVVQLYISEVKPFVVRPPKELKGFKKIFLEPNEEKTVTFTLNKRSFAYFNTDVADWHVKSGDFTIFIGKSSRNMVLEKTVSIQSSNPSVTEVTQEMIYVKRKYLNTSNKITRNTMMEQLLDHPIGIRVYNEMKKQMLKTMNVDESNPENAVFDANATIEFLNNVPFRGLVAFSQGKGLSEKRMNRLIFLLNRTRKDTVLGKILRLFMKTKAN